MTIQSSLDVRRGAESLPGRIRALRSEPWTIALLVSCIAMSAIAAHEGILDLYDRWRFEEEYGHGFIVVALVPLFLWGRRNLILQLSSRRTWPGVVLVVVAQLLGIVANLAESYYAEQLAVVMTVLGLLIAAFGTGPIRLFAPMAALLVLAVPLPYTLQAMLTLKLQLLSTSIGTGIIDALGIPVFVEGNIVDLGDYQLQVAEACSGLRYLFPLLCIGLVIAVLYRAPAWKRAVLVVSAVPLTVLINGARIAVTGVLVNAFGNAAATGFLHWFEGYVIFGLAASILLLEIVLLQGFRFTFRDIDPLFQSTPTATARAPMRLTVSRALAVFACAGGLTVTSLLSLASGSAPPPNRQMLATFPGRIGDWVARPQQLDSIIVEKLKATDTLLADFGNNAGARPVNVFIAYYDFLTRGAAIHSPRVCLPAGGWEFVSFQERAFPELSPSLRGTFNRVIIQKGTDRMLMYYWYQQREHRTASEFGMKYRLLADALTTGRKDGALVRLLTPIGGAGPEDEAAAEREIRAYAQAALPVVDAYLPQ
jgi:exosortase D (VPLPA-CTERM-specific)